MNFISAISHPTNSPLHPTWTCDIILFLDTHCHLRRVYDKPLLGMRQTTGLPQNVRLSNGFLRAAMENVVFGRRLQTYFHAKPCRHKRRGLYGTTLHRTGPYYSTTLFPFFAIHPMIPRSFTPLHHHNFVSSSRYIRINYIPNNDHFALQSKNDACTCPRVIHDATILNTSL